MHKRTVLLLRKILNLHKLNPDPRKAKEVSLKRLKRQWNKTPHHERGRIRKTVEAAFDNN